MSRKRKKNNNLIRKYVSIIIIILVLLYISNIILGFIKQPTDIVMVEHEEISLTETVEGYIIRDEVTVNTDIGVENSEIIQIKNEGDKVAEGDPIFRYKNEDESQISEQINLLNIQIQEALDKETNVFPRDIELLEIEIAQQLTEVFELNDMQKINQIKNSINDDIIKKVEIAGELSPSGDHINELISTRNQYEEQLNENSKYVKAPASGVVSYRIDGYEDVLNINNIENISKKTIESIDIKAGQIVANNENAAKIINNFKCYIAVSMTSMESREAKIGDIIEMRLFDNKRIEAEIIRVDEENNGDRLIIFEITKNVEELVEYRKISLEIIWWSDEGLKVPNSALKEKDGLATVTRNREGYQDEIYVEILNQTERYSIIENYTAKELQELDIDLDKVTIYRVMLYDEIVVYS